MSSESPSLHAESRPPEPTSWRLLLGSGVFLVATVVSGLLFRSQLGQWLGPLGGLDLRRAHSHLGFYGVLFPVTWLAWRAAGYPTPGGRLLTFYLFAVLLSGVGFLFQGYGFVSILGSTGVLIVWLQFAWAAFQASRKGARRWLASAAPSVVLASLLIAGVAVMTKRDPALALRLARTFLTLLLLGVFAPAALDALGVRAVPAGVWVLAVAMAAVSLTELHASSVFQIGPIALGVALLVSIARSWRASELRDRGIAAHWGVFALGTVATGLQLMPHSHPIAIAGIHYLILGPLLLTHLSARDARAFGTGTRATYEACVLGMVLSIGLLAFLPGSYLVLQRSAAVLGVGILLILLRIFMKLRNAPTFPSN